MSALAWVGLGALVGVGLGFGFGAKLSARRGRASRAAPPARSDAAESVELELELDGLRELARLTAHDVRNSLSVLYSTADLLEADRPASQRRELLGAVQQESDRVRRAIEVLGDRARPMAGPRSTVPVSELVEAAVRRARAMPGWLASQQVEWDVEDGTVLEVDPPRLVEGLAHLLLVAGSGAAPRLRVGQVSGDDSVELRVEAVGGAELPADLFSERAIESPRGPVAGGPLGLCLARRAIREHGGTLRAEVRGESGLQACVELPRSS